jgi:hypothetical protein
MLISKIKPMYLQKKINRILYDSIRLKLVIEFIFKHISIIYYTAISMI